MLNKFYRNFYRPENCVLVYAGPPGKNTQRCVEKAFSGKWNHPVPRTSLEKYIPNKDVLKKCVPSKKLQKIMSAACKGDPQKNLTFIKNSDAIKSYVLITFRCKKNDEWWGMDSKKKYAATMLSCILGGYSTARLMKEIREKRGVVYGVYSDLDLHTDKGSLVINTNTEHKNLYMVLGLIFKEIMDIVSGGISGKELKNSKKYYAGNMMLALEDIQASVDNAGSVVLHQNKKPDFKKELEKYKSVTLGEVHSLAKELFTMDNMEIIIISNKKYGLC